MKKTSVVMMALCGAILFTAPAYASEMSDTVHRKTMGGLHHQEQMNEDKGEASSMSDGVHRKTMGGLHHQKQEENSDGTETPAVMSDGVHRKTMGGLKHEQ